MARLESALEQFGKSFDKRIVRPSELDAIIAVLGASPPEFVVRAGAKIVSLARLYRYRPLKRRWIVFPARRDADQDMLPKHRGLELLFLFHADGYVREAALNSIQASPQNAFFFAAIVWRLNDWVQPVRLAARRCASRVFPLTDADVIVRAAPYLLDRRYRWGRWTAEAAVLDEVLSRPDVLDRFVDGLCNAHTGPAGRLLRFASRWPPTDRHLPDLASKAFLPEVRAVALQSLIERTAKWPDGFKREWVDKIYNQSRMVPSFGERMIDTALQREELVRLAAKDRAARVRLIAAAALVTHHAELSNASEIVQLLANDRSRAVRERVDFVIRRYPGQV